MVSNDLFALIHTTLLLVLISFFFLSNFAQIRQTVPRESKKKLFFTRYKLELFEENRGKTVHAIEYEVEAKTIRL